MAYPWQQSAFTTGEVAPELFGRQDLARLGVAAGTARNMFVRYTGGLSSRAGFEFCSFSKQTGRDYPARLIDFQFSAQQGLALEFGDHYMRVFQNGQAVTETPIAITNATQTNPVVISLPGGGTSISATADNTGVLSSYAPGELVTLAGGTFLTPAVLSVLTTRLLRTQVLVPGIGSPLQNYVPGDTIDLAGGTQSVQSQIVVQTTQAIVVSLVNGGVGGIPADGPNVVTGTTGAGTLVQVNVTMTGGVITSIDGIANAGSYTTNPTVLTNEPVTGAGAGAAIALYMGVRDVVVSVPGVFTANPSAGEFTQLATSGTGVGATFNFALMGIDSMGISNAGNYTVPPPNPASQAATTGFGSGAVYNVAYVNTSIFNNGDWVSMADVGGMTEINNQIFVVAAAAVGSFTLTDVYGNPIDGTGFGAYTGGGTAARIYTLTTPYAEEDLKWLKYSQSADVMTLTCVNQDTSVEYVPVDLVRLANNNWVFENIISFPVIAPPTGGVADASSGGSVNYQWRVTAIDPETGEESEAGPIIFSFSSVNMAATAGSVVLTWNQVPDVQVYNVYKATPGYGRVIPFGVLFGFIGQAYGTSFVDSNNVPDFTQVPPLVRDPFARGQVIGATPTAGGAGYITADVTVVSATGSGASIVAVISTAGAIIGLIIEDPGSGYLPTDTILITSPTGTGAAAVLSVGDLTGTYPSVTSYFQQRRVYANSIQHPDTYWMSQPGAFRNFMVRIPTLDTDAITGSPWSVQVNGIQFMLNMPGGLVALTGREAWQLTGVGGSSFTPQPLTPASQQAQPQAYNGCSSTVPPVKIDYDIIYLQAMGSIWRNFAYQYNTNIYTGVDLTLNSSQLFTGKLMRERAWTEEPFKTLWVVREDGILLSLTFVRPQEIAGWTRHDTNGLFKSVCSVGEPPVNALYACVERFFPGGRAYTIERQNNRVWAALEDCWCVDCGSRLPQDRPDGTLTVSSASGLGTITGSTDLVPGSGYSMATTAIIVDDNGDGPGTGATAFVDVNPVTGAINFVAITNPGTKYRYPQLSLNDPLGQGSGFSCHLTLDNQATATTTNNAFNSVANGDIIRSGGGIIEVTQVTTSNSAIVQILSPITELIPNVEDTPAPQAAGNWTATTPVSTVSGLRHLAGMTVTGLYDGQVIPPTVVSADGEITLPAPATAVIVGLGFGVQFQTIYLDMGTPTVQGRRKKVAAATARVAASGPFTIGANQPDGSTLSPPEIAPYWTNMVQAPTPTRAPYNWTTAPFFTGDIRIPLLAGFETPGQAAIEQNEPLPLNILSVISEDLVGDDVDIAADRRRQQGQSGSVDT